MSKVETGRFSERLRRSLGMKGQELVAAELSPEISPVIVLQDDSAEWQFLQGVRLCASAILEIGVVGENTLFRALNPAGSGVIITLTSIRTSLSLVSQFNLGYGVTQAALGSVGATAVRDGRWGRSTNPTTLRLSSANNVAFNLQSSLWVTAIVPNVELVFSEPSILLPGESYEWGTATLNVTIRSTLSWTERQLPSLEE